MKERNSIGDRAGMLIAAACFVHCVAGPILLSFAGLASLVGISEKLEPLFLLSSFGAGAATLIPAYRNKHRRLSCLVLFLAGLACFVMRGHLGWTGGFVEPILVGAGAFLIIGAHALNLKLSRRCRCCELPESNVRRWRLL
jgi:MerC mercury resistance protein